MVERRNDWVEVELGAIRAPLFVRNWIPPEPNGWVVFCVHGIACVGSDFAFLGRYLARRGYRVVAPDLVGHGRSTYPGRAITFGTGSVARCLGSVAAHYADAGNARVFIGSSAGAGFMTLFLAATGMEAAAVVINDFALEWGPRLRDGTSRLVRDLALRFDTAAQGKAHARRRDEEMFHQRDTHDIAPAILDHFLGSRLRQVDGKYAYAVDLEMLSNADRITANQQRYPDFYKAVSSINSRRVLLLFGEHSQHRNSKVKQRLAADFPHITVRSVPRAAHPPRLLTAPQAHLVHTFIERARAG